MKDLRYARVIAATLTAGTLFVAVAYAQAGRQGPTIEQQVIDASNRWFQAVVAVDVETVQAMETDDFLSIQLLPRGLTLIGKTAQLESMKRTATPAQKLQRTLRGVRVRTYGSTAVLTAGATITGTNATGGRVRSETLTTEVWVNQGGTWKVAHFQPANVPPPPNRP